MMTGGRHLQRGTNRMLTFNAFYGELDSAVSIAALVREGDRLLAQPMIELIYRPAHGSLEDVVVACMVRYLNDTSFDEGEAAEQQSNWTDYGPWK